MKKLIGILVVIILILIIIGRCASTNRNNQIIMNEYKNPVVTDTEVIGEYLYNIDGSLSEFKDNDGNPTTGKDFLDVIESMEKVSTDTFGFETEDLAYGFYQKIHERYYSEKDVIRTFITENSMIRAMKGEYNVIYTPYENNDRWIVEFAVYKPK